MQCEKDPARASEGVRKLLIASSSAFRRRLHPLNAIAALAILMSVAFDATQPGAGAAQPAGVAAPATQPKEDRVQVLTQELIEAKRKIEAFQAQFQAEAAESVRSLEREQQKSAALMQEVAAARQELATATAKNRQALAEERERRSSLLDTATVKHRQALNEERERYNKLAGELAEKRREIAAQIAQLRTVGAEAAAARQELAAAAETQLKALEEERVRNGALVSELAKMRHQIETQAVQLGEGSKEAERRAKDPQVARSLEQEREKNAALVLEIAAAREASTANAERQRQALGEERARSGALEVDLAKARHESETRAALIEKASEVWQRGSAEAAKSAELLEEERRKAEALAREVVALRQAAITSSAQHQQAITDERERRAALWSELAGAQRTVETQAALLAKVAVTEVPDDKVEVAKNAQLLEQERMRAAAVAEQAATARLELAASTEKHRQALEEERARSLALSGEVAASRRKVETLTEQLRVASEAEVQARQAIERTTMDFRKSLQQERDRAEAMARDVESLRRTIVARSTSAVAANNQASNAARPAEMAPIAKPPGDEVHDSSEVTKSIARARALLGQGNISAARVVLEHAAETGSALASFALAETYDPLVLLTWKTYGTLGDAAKARELYERAYAGGVQDAKRRADALDQLRLQASVPGANAQ
jgi:hypothetical protein